MSHIGLRAGLVGEERYARVVEKYRKVEAEIARLGTVVCPPSEAVNALLRANGSAALKTGVSMADLIRRPELGYEKLAEIDPDRPDLTADIRESVEISIRYEGYIRRQKAQVEQFKRMENRRLPEDLDYQSISALRIEARQKLAQARPLNLGQASRISGVSPADITALMIYLENHTRGGDANA